MAQQEADGDEADARLYHRSNAAHDGGSPEAALPATLVEADGRREHDRLGGVAGQDRDEHARPALRSDGVVAQGPEHDDAHDRLHPERREVHGELEHLLTPTDDEHRRGTQQMRGDERNRRDGEQTDEERNGGQRDRHGFAAVLEVDR